MNPHRFTLPLIAPLFLTGCPLAEIWGSIVDGSALVVDLGAEEEAEEPDEDDGDEPADEDDAAEPTDGDEPTDDDQDQPVDDDDDEPADEDEPVDDEDAVSPPAPPTPAAFVPHVIQDCDTGGGYDVTGFATEPIPGLPTLTSINVYQTHGNHSGGYHPMGYATVVVDAPGPQSVALSSYEPVTWSFEVGPDTQLVDVFVLGYHDQIVEVDPSVPVTYLGTSPACGYAYPDDGQGCDTDGVIETIEAAAGQPIQHFEGCYDASVFHVTGGATPPPVQPSTVAPGIIQDCATGSGYEVYSLEGPQDPGMPHLTLVGIYETHSNHAGGYHPMGYATVDVSAPGEHIVALSSYEPVTWQLDIGADASVQAIYTIGYHEQVVEGAGGVPVIELPGSCGYSWPYNGGGCDTAVLMDTVEAAAGQSIQRFEGCYRATSFSLQQP